MFKIYKIVENVKEVNLENENVSNMIPNLNKNARFYVLVEYFGASRG